MLFAELAQTSAHVAATRSRTGKRALLAAAISAAAPEEIAVVVAYLSGGLRQRRTNLGWSSMPSVEPACAPEWSVAQVDATFEQIARQAGPGSTARRTALLTHLLTGSTAPEQHLLRGLILTDIRQGALDALVQDALACAFDLPAPAVRRAAMLLGSTPAAAELLISGGPSALDSVSLQVGTPVRPMLAAAAPDAATAVTKSGLPAAVDAKLDGIRVQVHRDAHGVRVFTRSLDEITTRVPEIVSAVMVLRITDAVLDGELIALDEAGRPRPFQVTAARAATDRPAGSVPAAPTAGRRAQSTPLTLFCFDVLRLDGQDLLDRPLSERAAVMRERLPAELVVPRILAQTVDAITGFFADVIDSGFEGVVIKRLDAPYAAGRRDSGWVKLKPRYTFDLAVTAAEWGYGRRTGLLSNLHLAARDPVSGELLMLGKTFKGLTDDMLAWQTAEIQARSCRRTRSVVYADPPLVAEVACDGLQDSSRYPGGVALRFARILRYRTDKTPDEVDTIDTVRALAPPAGDVPSR